MKKIIFIYTFMIGLMTVYGQIETMNQIDNQGKKNGKWIVYLDAKWNKTDSNNAIFYRYTWFDHGVNIHPMGAGGSKNATMQTASNNSMQTGKLKILDGKYEWYEKGKLKYVHVLKNGEYVAYKEYNSAGKLITSFDYTKGCEGQAHSWTMYIYDKNGNVMMTTPICKDVNGKWPKMHG